MQWNELKSNWKDAQTKIQAKWPQLTADDLKAIAGRRDELIKRLRKHVKLDEAALGKQVDEFVQSIKPAHV